MASRVSALFRSIRLDEVALLQGTPLMGVAFSIGAITTKKLELLILFMAANILLVTHIFTFNDWAAAAQNGQQPNKAATLVYNEHISSRLLFFFSVALLVASLFLFAFVGWHSLALATAIAAVGIFYSHPWLNAKGTPIGASLPHLAGGLLHFLLGYTLFTSFDQRGVLIGLFFAFTFTAGHLNHEVADFEHDRQAGLRTNAVTFGKRPIFIASLIVFLLAYMHLLFLSATGLVPRLLGVWAIVCFPIHVTWALAVLRRGLTTEAVKHFQVRYRLTYSLLGGAIFLSLFAPWARW